MDLFELLILAAFVLFPILDGILKQRQKGRGSEKEGQGQGPDRSTAQRRPEGRAESPRSAADMLPDDLWELMTGEKRPRQEPETQGSPWSSTPAETQSGPATSTAESGAAEPEPWVVDDEATAPEPVSLEYEGPEAYSLEAPAPEPRSLEQPIPSPSARHRAFHEMIDRPERRPTVRTSPLIRSLSTPSGLRQAVLAREILGPPKGLE